MIAWPRAQPRAWPRPRRGLGPNLACAGLGPGLSGPWAGAWARGDAANDESEGVTHWVARGLRGAAAPRSFSEVRWVFGALSDRMTD